MNTRLHSLYNSLLASNLDPFLKNEIELDDMWGKQIWGLLLIVNLDDKVEEMLSQYQQYLEEIEPGNFTFPPYGAQHLTINQVVHGLGNYSLGNKKTWDSIKDEFLPAFQKLDRKFTKIHITFSKLIATKGGIIWCATDENDEIENLRNELFDALRFPKETTKKVHFIHTTVARYKNKLNNPQVVLDFVSKTNVEIPMTIDKIILRNETIFPSMEFRDIAQIEMK